MAAHTPTPLSTAGIQPDTPRHYGTITRWMHWGMALFLAWMFFIVLVHVLAEKSALDNALWSWHKPTGLVLWLLAIVRCLWALTHRQRQPASLNLGARLGHLGLYALMLAIPTIGLLRQYGSGRAFEAFGLTVMAARPGDKIDWMVDLGGLLHGELGWVLLACIVGHAAMALWHRRDPATNVLPRMWGR